MSLISQGIRAFNGISRIAKNAFNFVISSSLRKDLRIASAKNGPVSKELSLMILDHLNPHAKVLVSGSEMPIWKFAHGVRNDSTCFFVTNDGIFFVFKDNVNVSESTGLKVTDSLTVRIHNALERLYSYS